MISLSMPPSPDPLSRCSVDHQRGPVLAEPRETFGPIPRRTRGGRSGELTEGKLATWNRNLTTTWAARQGRTSLCRPAKPVSWRLWSAPRVPELNCSRKPGNVSFRELTGLTRARECSLEDEPLRGNLGAEVPRPGVEPFGLP